MAAKPRYMKKMTPTEHAKMMGKMPAKKKSPVKADKHKGR